MLWLALLAAQAAPSSPCQYDRARLLALDQNAFDQDMTGGWRKLEEDGCEAEPGQTEDEDEVSPDGQGRRRGADGGRQRPGCGTKGLSGQTSRHGMLKAPSGRA